MKKVLAGIELQRRLKWFKTVDKGTKWELEGPGLTPVKLARFSAFKADCMHWQQQYVVYIQQHY